MILLDIMKDGRFVCQLRYDKHGIPELIDGEIKEVYDARELEEFVYEQRPSLRNKNIRIEFATQKVI